MKRLAPVAFGKLAGKKRSPASNWQLGIILSFIAGYINAGGYLIVRHYTSHMTGVLSDAAEGFASGDLVLALSMLGFLLCFVFGAALTTVLIRLAKRRSIHAQFSLPLILEAMLILAVGVLMAGLSGSPVLTSLMIAVLCFLMGLQNALITKASTAVVRTTHVTGMTTDLGIEIGRLLVPGDGERVGLPLTRIVLFSIVIAAFLVGGVSGAMIVRQLEAPGLLPVSALLLLIAAPPVWRDISSAMRRSRRGARP